MPTHYEIDSELAIIVFLDDNDYASIIQPNWPDGQAWKNKVEATAWAEQFVLALTDETAELAGPNPEQPTVSRPIENLPAV